MDENKKAEVCEEGTETCECQENCDCVKEEQKEKKFGKKKKKTKEEELLEEVETLRVELQKMQNSYYKAYADTENLKKRLQNDADILRKYRIQSFAQEILPAMDNLERAIAIETEDEEMKKYVDGIRMIHQQMKIALENEGLIEIESLNLPFDPNVHQALVTEKLEGVDSGMVLEEIQKGYKLKDRVIRATLVKVSE